MLEPRIIPCLLLMGAGLVKGIKFKDHRYVGDPINAVQIFNSKEADEILFLDITATLENRKISTELIQRVADQCLIPFGVGGGIQSIQDARSILNAGAEKVCLNTAALERPELIREIADTFGSQSVIVSIDVKKSYLGKYEVYVRSGTKKISGSIEQVLDVIQSQGAGEVIINSIDRDGTREGYDLNLIRRCSDKMKIPLIALGGAGSVDDLSQAIIGGGADAVAAGSLFVFHGRRRGVLISYLSEEERGQFRRAIHS